jgi:hypothetical protein
MPAARAAVANIGASDELYLLVGHNDIELLPLADDALKLAQGLRVPALHKEQARSLGPRDTRTREPYS